MDVNGYVSEGSGENVFVVRHEVLQTAPLGTLCCRDYPIVLKIAQSLEFSGRTRYSTELLYLADEAFFTGTAAEITPIRSVDKISVSSITDHHAVDSEGVLGSSGEAGSLWWLTPVGQKQATDGV